MKKETLTKIIIKIKEHDLIDYFDTKKKFKEWVTLLNEKQINNFLSLNIKKEDYMFPSYILIDLNLLDCDDYINRVKTLQSLRNVEGCYELFKNLVSPIFLKSDKWYKDIEFISKADTIGDFLSIISKEEFINSPYHDEDLNLILNSKDNAIKYEKTSNIYDVKSALASVASNSNSIKSPYHASDMQLIANVGSDCISRDIIYFLAEDETSLNDKYHHENMLMLSKSKSSKINSLLHKLFTNKEVINSPNYNEIRDVFQKIDNEFTALAVYSYIVNIDYNEYYIYRIIKGTGIRPLEFDVCTKYGEPGKMKKFNPKFMKYISLIKGPISLYITYLLSNENFITLNKHMLKDLEFIKTHFTEEYNYDKLEFITETIVNPVFIESPYHEEDLEMIYKASNDMEYLLEKCATNENNVKSKNHQYDMQFIMNYQDDEITPEIDNLIFTEKGINDENHVILLEKIKNGEEIDYNIFDSIDKLYEYIQEKDEVIEEKKDEKGKVFQKIKKVFK